MAKIQEENVAPSSIASLITTYFERSTLEAELRAHKALTILHSRDVQVEQLQQRVAQLQSAADRVSPVNLVVPPLRLPPSPGSDEGFAYGCEAELDADADPDVAGSDNDLDDQDDDVYVEMLSDSGPSSDSLYSDTAGDSSGLRGGVSCELGADPLPPPLDFARVPTPPPPRPARSPASASAPSPLPADAPPGPQPRKLPCHLATDAGIRPTAPWGIGGGDRDTLSCDEIERRRKRKLEETNRKRKLPQRPGSHSYPLRADLPAAAAVVVAAAAAAEERGLAAAATPDPRAAPRLGDGPCLRSCLTLDAQQEAAGRLGEETGVVAATAAEAGRPDCGDCTSPAAGDHATCHRLIDELRLYNKQLRAALRLAQASQLPVAGVEALEEKGDVQCPMAVPPPAPRPPPPAASRSVQTLGERQCDGASQTDVAAAADCPAQTFSPEVADTPAQTTYALPTLKDIEAERKEARSLAAEAARQAAELQEVRRHFCDLQLAHEALQTQLRHQAVVDELKRHTMEELRERLEQLERSVAADAEADADDASDVHEGDGEVFADAETDVGRDVPPQWMLEAAICRARARSSPSEARGMQTELEGAELEELSQRLATAQLEVEEQRLAARALGERLAQLSKAAARELQAKRKHVKKQIEKAVKRRMRALCRAVSDAYGLTLTPHDLLLARRSETSEVSSEDWSAGEGSEGSIVAVEGTPSPATSLASSPTPTQPPSRLPRHAPLCRRADLQAATRRLGAVRKQLRLTRVSYLRAKKKIVRQDRCLKAKQVYHAYLEKTLSGLRAETEELQREMFATKLENDRLLERVRRLEAGETTTGKQVSEAKATESKTSRPPTRRRVASCVRRSQRATSLPPPALQAAQAPPAPPSTPASPSALQQQQPPSTPLSGAASATTTGAAATASLTLVPLPPMPPPPAPGEESVRTTDDERRKMLNARLRAATQNIAALNKMVNNLRQQLQASEDSLQRCKERLNRVEACNQNRLQLVESYKVKTQDLEQRLEAALSKSTSQLQTIDVLRNSNGNLKCQLAKVTTQRDECIQEAITVRKTLEEQLGRKTSELQARAISETEQKIQEAKLHYARCTSEQNRKLKEAAEKLNQFGHSIETFLKMVQQRERGMYSAPAGLLPAGDDRPQRQEALARAATILNLTPTQLHNFMADPGDTNRRREFTQWMSYCRQLFCRDVFSQLLAEFLFKVVLAKFEPDFVQGLTDKDLS